MNIVPKLIVMVGIPGSGKSTIAEKYSKKYDAKIYSSDNYRQLLFGDENDQSHNNSVFDALYKDLSKELSRGNSCIIDATNISVKSRKKALDIISSTLKNVYKVGRNFVYDKVAVVCLTGIYECIKRDRERKRTVGENVILTFVSQFEFPQTFEGFDFIELEIDKNSCNTSSRANFYGRMSGFNQNSKYHKYDLLTHSLVLADSFDFADDRYEASLFHDIGKVCTESRDNEGYSHYYNHANHSAYIIACNLDVLKVRYNYLNVIFYINQHMHIRDIIKSEKATKKYKNLWGDERFYKLVEFMNKDNIASGRVQIE